MNFKDLLLLAKSNEAFAINKMLEMYKPLLIKESIINGFFDEDLYQELQLTFLYCIEKNKSIKFFKVLYAMFTGHKGKF